MDVDPRATVRALLAAAGLRPPEDEVEKMIQSYPGLRAAADRMYTDEISRHLPVVSPPLRSEPWPTPPPAPRSMGEGRESR